MGCAISKGRIIDSSKPISSIDIQLVDIPDFNHYFTDEDNSQPKCVFIFGGSGSSKGEFIWELLEQFSANENDDSTYKYTYRYIDVEKLILDNIGKRIKKLTSDKPSSLSAEISESDNGRESRQTTLSSEASCKTSSSDDLKTKMLLYANIVTNNWVLGLITKEIERHVRRTATKEKVFLINLIPNRINVFRNCLYLKQAPSFVNFHFNYIAVNLIKSNSKRKDLDQLNSNCCYDEVNNNFINYFRLINKLIEVKVDHRKIKLKIKAVSKASKNAIKVVDNEDLVSFAYMPKRDGMEVDFTEFQCSDSHSHRHNHDTHGSIIFVIKNEIELDECQVLVFDDNEIALDSVRKFVHAYAKVKQSLIM